MTVVGPGLSIGKSDQEAGEGEGNISDSGDPMFINTNLSPHFPGLAYK